MIRDYLGYLIKDAHTLDHQAAEVASKAGLILRDVYVRGGGAPDSDESQLSIVLTPRGHQLKPGDQVHHFLVYFSDPQEIQPDETGLSNIIWIEEHQADGKVHNLVLKEDFFGEKATDPYVDPLSLSTIEMSDFLSLLKSMHPTPQVRAPGISDT
jgi:hypothetical protein